jgi:hypothetical protein
MKKHEKTSIINSDILGRIENYVREHENFTLKLLGFAGEITISGYSFPSSFDYDEARNGLSKLKYKSLISLLNSTYKKLGISKLSQKEFDNCIGSGSEYWYLDIAFATPVPLSEAINLKLQPHNFMFFMTNHEEGKNTNFKMMYSDKLFFNYVEGFDRAIYLDFERPEIAKNEKYQTAISCLEAVLYWACKTIEIEIHEYLELTKFDRLILPEPTLETFESLIELMTLSRYSNSEYKKDAKKTANFLQERI